MTTVTVAHPTKSCDARELVFVHQAFRRLYSLAPGAVLGTDPSDRKRVAAVASTLQTVNNALHHHHVTEDTKIWDTLEQRRPACMLHVELMKSQHATVADLLDESPALLDAWRTNPTPATAEALAAKFAEIDALLSVHLRDEETKIIPVIEEVFSAREWKKVENAAKATYDPAEIVLFLGLIMEVMPPEERADFESSLPTPVMWVWQLFGRPHYDRMMSRLRV